LAIANIFNDLHIAEEKLGIRLGPKNFAERRHENAVNNFLLSFFDGDCQDAQRNLLEAAKIRKCLG
ncbi:MAG: hypothetical protein QXQ41_00260, partial [Candidatus Bathyarchaeia archaeon]